MQFPSRRARVALLAGCATIAVAAPASAATTNAFDAATGKLTVGFNDITDITIGAAAGKVQVNGANATGDIDASAVKTLEVRETDTAGTNANTVDLSGVTGADYTQLTSTLIRAEGGVDTLTGTQLDDRIEGGKGNDVMNGIDGNDTLVWRQGEGSDTMNGGDGVDTIENDGGTGPETFETNAVPNSARVTFKRTAPVGTEFTLDIGGAEKLVNNMSDGDDVFKGNDLSTLVTTVNGGTGNDTITGTVAGDTLNGEAGNDTINGAKGNDTMNGGDNDDVLIWNPGDGSDTDEGGLGNDVVQDNGGAAAEHFIVSANGQRVTATRDTGAPFFLDISAETLALNMGGGDDSADINNGLGALIKVAVNAGEGNDTINARNDSSQAIDGAGGADIAHVDATDTVANVETVDAPGAADRKAPKVSLAAKIAKVKRGRAAVKVRCPGGESFCKGTLRILRNGKTVGSIAINLTGGQTKVYKVKLARKTRVALVRSASGKLGATLKITAKDRAGNTGKSSAKLTLKR
jgi:Ca2+-binding RTX toxin-like protein